MLGVRSYPIVHGAPPSAPEPEAPTNVSALWRESSVAWEAVRLVGATPGLLGRARVQRTVVLIPGFRASGSSMAPLRRLLAWRGHDARDWGLGTNRGDPEGDVERMKPRLETIVAQVGAPVVLVGWSLGGVVARELARERPDLVERVVTYGTPVVGGPRFTLASRRWDRSEIERITQMIDQRDQDCPIQVPMTLMFTRNDRIVAWPACLDHVSALAEHVEVGSGHLGMILDPDVWRVAVDRIERGQD
ncbi:MAG: alpha/beta fold hydrolase [Myxococcota bacterium]